MSTTSIQQHIKAPRFAVYRALGLSELAIEERAWIGTRGISATVAPR